MEGEIVNGQALVPAQPQPTMIRPLASADEALDAWQAFQALKGKLVTKDDIQHIQGRDFIKKSGWRKIAAAFGISTEVRSETREEMENNHFLWRVTVRATAPNGRYTEGTAGCASNERRFSHIQHDVYAQAFTRACNRAISDLVGGGDVSAEEVSRESLPPLNKAQAEGLVLKFSEAIVHRSDFPTLPTSTEVLTATVMTHGDLRQAYRILKSWQPEATESVPDDEDDG